VDYIISTKVIVGEGLKVTEGPNGTLVSTDATYVPFRHPFRVRVTGNKATVADGLVNSVSPYVSTGDDRYVNLSGFDPEGKATTVPGIEFENEGAQFTFIALSINLAGEVGRSYSIVDSPESIKLIHVESLDGYDQSGGGVESPDETVLYPIARLQWSTSRKSVDKVMQIVHHNIGHRFVEGVAEQGVANRHFFWAV
jgi:hypothetical protein